jgi:hypothetical protein
VRYLPAFNASSILVWTCSVVRPPPGQLRPLTAYAFSQTELRKVAPAGQFEGGDSAQGAQARSCRRIFGQTKITQGLFLILVARAQAPVWDISAKHHIERKKPMPYITTTRFT